MSTFTINIFSDNNDKVVLDLLHDLKEKNVLDVSPARKSISIPGSPISSQELIEQIELARKSTKNIPKKRQNAFYNYE